VSTLDKLVSAAAKRPAARTFKLLPEFFAESWSNRPKAAFEVGLRVPGEQEYRNAVIEAEKAQGEAFAKACQDPNLVARAEELGISAYNAKLVTFCVARGMCNQHNVTLPHPYFELPEDEIPLALKSRAIQQIFDAIERLAIDQSQVMAEATEIEVLELAELLALDDSLEGLDPAKRSRCLRYLKLVLDTLRE
jgi:hypothetical protein